MRNPLIPLSVCAILVLAACGDDDSVSSPTDPTLRPPVAVNVVGSGGDTSDEGAPGRISQNETAVATDTDMSTGLMPAFGGYVFEVGEGLPALPTNSTGYHFPAGVTVDADQVARVAAALGVEGEPLEVPSDPGSFATWRVGPDDGSAPALFVSNDGQLSWSYSIAWATVAFEGCGVSGSEGSVTGSVVEGDAATGVAVAETIPVGDTPPPDQPTAIEECPTPEPPAGVPTADEAATKTNELLTALGEDPAAFELETYADEWSASVTAYTTLDGVRWPSGYGFGFGAEGALQWASGTLADPVATGPYPLVDLDTAIARLADQNGMWGYGAVDVLAVDARETVDAQETVAAAPDEVARDKTADDEQTMPIDDGSIPPTPEPIVATLVDVKADLWWVWDTDTSVWLLPAYTFTDTEGNVFTVPAVTDEYMIVVEPTIEPQPVPAEPLDPVVVDPPTPDPATSGPATSDIAPADPALLDEFVGVPLLEFEEVAKRYGFTTRVVRQDDVDLSVTADFSDSRVNVAVKDDIVVEIVSFG